MLRVLLADGGVGAVDRGTAGAVDGAAGAADAVSVGAPDCAAGPP